MRQAVARDSIYIGQTDELTVMTAIDSVIQVAHVLFAGLWTGSLLFVVGAVLPASTAGSISAAAMTAITSRLVWLTRSSALVFITTGGHLAGTRYTGETLFSTGRGQLVVTMLVLWLALTALVEIGVKRFDRSVAAADVPTAVDATRWIFLLAGVLAAALLVDAGLLATGVSP